MYKFSLILLFLGIAFVTYIETRSALDYYDSQFEEAEDIPSGEKGSLELGIAGEEESGEAENDAESVEDDENNSIGLQGSFSYNPSTDGDPDKALDKYIASLPPGYSFPDTPQYRQKLRDMYQKYLGKPLPQPSQQQLQTIDVELNMAELQRHNEYRAKHMADPLVYDEKIAVYAQSYANTLASIMAKNGYKMVHNEDRRQFSLGENIATDGPKRATCDSNGICDWGEKTWKPVNDGHNTDMWYAELEFYKENGYKPIVSKTHSGGKATGHFTQVVWKGSSRMGCGMGCFPKSIPNKPNKGCVVVCNYYMPGNVDGKYDENVFVQK